MADQFLKQLKVKTGVVKRFKLFSDYFSDYIPVLQSTKNLYEIFIQGLTFHKRKLIVSAFHKFSYIRRRYILCCNFEEISGNVWRAWIPRSQTLQTRRTIRSRTLVQKLHTHDTEGPHLVRPTVRPVIIKNTRQLALCQCAVRVVLIILSSHTHT